MNPSNPKDFKDFKTLINTWETQSDMWGSNATSYAKKGDPNMARLCKAQQHVFKRCARNLRGLINYYDIQPEEPQKTHYFLRIVKYIFHV